MAGFVDAVKTLVVRFRSDGWELVKAEIDDIPDEKTVKIDMDSSAFGNALRDLMARYENDLAQVDNNSGGGGLLGRMLFGSLGGSGGLGPLPAFLSSPIALAGIGAAIGALSTEILGVVSGFAAAGQGVVAFGALSYPTLSGIMGAVTQIGTDTAAYQSATTKAAKSADLAKIKADWAALDPVQKTAVQNVLSLQSQFDALAKKFEPLLAPILKTVLGKGGIISQILGDLPAFAGPAAKAIEPLLKQFDNFLKSPGAAAFQNAMIAIEKLAIPAIGQGIGQVAGAIGKLLTVMSAKDDARAIKLAFDIITGAINGVRFVIEGLMKAWDWITQVAVPAMKHAWDNVSHAIDNFNHAIDNVIHVFDNIGHAIGNFNHAIDNVRHFVAVAGSDIGHVFSTMKSTIDRWVSDVGNDLGKAVAWFKALPGRILGALSGLAGQLFSAGAHIVSSLVAGLASQLGSVLSIAGRIASAIAGFFPNSPAKTGPFSGIGAPEKRGEHISWALGQGMLSGLSGVTAASARVANAAAGNIGPSGVGVRYGGGGGSINITVNGFVGSELQLATQIQASLLRLKRTRFGVQGSTAAGLGLA